MGKGQKVGSVKFSDGTGKSEPPALCKRATDHFKVVMRAEELLHGLEGSQGGPPANLGVLDNAVAARGDQNAVLLHLLLGVSRIGRNYVE